MKISFRPAKKGVAQILGDLESEVMKQVWKQPGSAARQVQKELAEERPLAYTTIVTILDRLYQKGLLTRARDGKAFRYSPSISREEFNKAVTRDVLQGLLKEDSRPIISTFVDLVSTEPELLSQLEELIKARRK